jgi:hypothetical protein
MNEHGMGAQARFARLLGWSCSTFWRKLNGKSSMTQADELAIRRAMEFVRNRPDLALKAEDWRKNTCVKKKKDSRLST